MSQLYPHVYFESGGIEEFDVDMMEEHDVELTLLDVAVIVNALDSINYAEKGVDLLMRKLTGVLSESMIILPHLDWEDRELIASEEEAYAEDEEEEDEDEEDEE